jgi:hypothetical protein
MSTVLFTYVALIVHIDFEAGKADNLACRLGKKGLLGI